MAPYEGAHFQNTAAPPTVRMPVQLITVILGNIPRYFMKLLTAAYKRKWDKNRQTPVITVPKHVRDNFDFRHSSGMSNI